MTKKSSPDPPFQSKKMQKRSAAKLRSERFALLQANVN